MSTAQITIQSGDPLVDHVSALIAEAARFHAIAIGQAVARQPEAARHAFAMSRVLADDAISFSDEFDARGAEAEFVLQGMRQLEAVMAEAAEQFERL